MKKNITIAILLSIGLILFSGCSSNEIIENEKENVKGISIGSQHIRGITYNYYAKDNQIYVEDFLLGNISPNGFEYFGDEFYNYYKDNNSLYFVEFNFGSCPDEVSCMPSVSGIKNIEKIMQPEIDLSSFKIIDSSIATDKNNVYKIESYGRSGNSDKKFLILKNIDPSSFKKNGWFVWDKDGDTAYWDYSVEINLYEGTIDFDSIKIINNDYVKDKNYVYYRGNILENSDPDTFELISNIHAKDKNAVYYRGKIIELADPITFIETFNDRGKDKNNYFINGKVIYDEERIKRSFRDYYNE